MIVVSDLRNVFAKLTAHPKREKSNLKRRGVFNRVNKEAGISLLISKLSLSSTYLFSEKQENLEHCCDILRKELKLLFTLEGILTLFIHIATDTKNWVYYRQFSRTGEIIPGT